MSDKPKAVKLTAEQTEELRQRISSSALADNDKEILCGLISFNLWLCQKISRAGFTIKKLKGYLGFSTEKKNSKKSEDVTEQNSDDADSNTGATDDTSQNNAPKTTSANDADGSGSQTNPDNTTPPNSKKKEPKWSADANHGRYGFDDYPGLETVVVVHPTLKPGAICPFCVKTDKEKKLSPKRTAVFISLIGSPLVTGTRYVAEGYECNLCGAEFKPEIPKEILNKPKYGVSAITNIAVGHYALGLPFNRIEYIQQSAGIPVPDATQYDKMAGLKKKLDPLYDCMIKLSINTDLMHYDDTSMYILETGSSHGTAIVSKCGEHYIYLYYTSPNAAGKTVGKLIKDRTSAETLKTMIDASNQNRIADADDILLSRLVVIYCLVHGRRKFHELIKDFPEVCHTVIETIAEVYKHETYCRKKKLNDEQRLIYHKQFSEPIMVSLHVYLTNLWEKNEIEHNSALGDAVKYMLQRWEGLTQFLRTPGCPIDNNICEQAIKVLIRYRKNSMFYRTLQGAMCGNVIMSVIYTAIRNNINPYNYLNTLQEYHHEVAADPEAFLPWNYQETIADMLPKAA